MFELRHRESWLVRYRAETTGRRDRQSASTCAFAARTPQIGRWQGWSLSARSSSDHWLLRPWCGPSMHWPPLSAPVAADDAGSDLVEVMYQGAAPGSSMTKRQPGINRRLIEAVTVIRFFQAISQARRLRMTAAVASLAPVSIHAPRWRSCYIVVRTGERLLPHAPSRHLATRRTRHSSSSHSRESIHLGRRRAEPFAGKSTLSDST